MYVGLIWLLSPDSNWLPEKHRSILIQGIKQCDRWNADLWNKHFGNPFLYALMNKTRKEFDFTTKIKNGLRKIVDSAKEELGIKEDSEKITRQLMDLDIINGYYDYRAKLNKKRK